MPNRRKPNQLHILEGTFRRDRHGGTVEAAPGVPTRPSWLCTEAKREWSRIVPHLARLGLLSKVDRASLAAYCQSWARYRQAEEIVVRKGSTMLTAKGNEIQRPEVSIARNYLDSCRRMAAEFGLTPNARGKMTIPDPPEDDVGLLD